MRTISYENLIEDYILSLIEDTTKDFRSFLWMLHRSEYISENDYERFQKETKNWSYWPKDRKVVDRETYEVIFDNNRYLCLKNAIRANGDKT